MAKLASGQIDGVGEVVGESAAVVDEMLRAIATTSESAFGIKPDEMGMQVLGAMLTGKPLAPLLNIDDNQIQATFEIACAKAKAGQLEEAVKLLRILVMIDFYNKRHWLMLALCLRKMSLMTSAGDCYCVAHVVDRSDLWPLAHAIECYLEARDLANAAELLEILESLTKSARLAGDASVGDLAGCIDSLVAGAAALQKELTEPEVVG